MASRLSDGALRDLVFTGRTVLVDEAVAIGLVDEKCPAGTLLDRALEVASHLASIPAGAFALTKVALLAGARSPRGWPNTTPASSKPGCSRTLTRPSARTWKKRSARNELRAGAWGLRVFPIPDQLIPDP